MADPADRREQALALLRHNHEFPCDYSLRVVMRGNEKATILSALASTRSRVVSVSERSSRKGSYTSLGLRLHVASAEAVLDAYEVLGRLDSVVTTL